MNGREIAYFSMEIALETEIPTYSGGLGVLAGDTIRAAADMSVNMVAITLLHRRGYFFQHLDDSGWQTEEPIDWPVDDHLAEMEPHVSLTLEGRTVQIRCWRYEMTGEGNIVVPVYLLDTDLPQNSDWDRTLTDDLYGGDDHYRLCQEVILGIGGVRMLRALGYHEIQRFHMNEGHAAFLTVELLEEELRERDHASITQDDIDAVRKQCVFTTHTPVPAGHDKFPTELVRQALGHIPLLFKSRDLFYHEGVMNMTYLALNLSHYVNGVAKRHGEISRHMFASHSIDAITNGVHVRTWVAPSFQELFDHYIPDWRQDNFHLRYALSIADPEIWDAHQGAKKLLMNHVNRRTNSGMDVDVFTLGFARRAAAYKRGDLLFTDLDRLRDIAANTGLLQVIYAGKAHPKDEEGKRLIQRIHEAKEALKGDIKVVYLENYDVELAKFLTAGVDVWLNTPLPPNEASGTSGMKAALNGVPSLSVLDGWWLEGHIEGVTGWAIGEAEDRSRDATSLYDQLQQKIIPMFYDERDGFIEIMRHAIALNGSFFNTQRMLQQYVLKAYFG